MTKIEGNLDPIKDDIKEVFQDDKGRVTSILFNDGSQWPFSDFINLFKMNLRTIVAGELVSWEDHWRFSRQTDARSFEEYLDNVENEGIQKGSRMVLNRPQKISLMLIIIIAVALIGMVLLYFFISKGGIKF